jgi:O-antigen/teichoic acid export membrane protein
MLDLFYKNGIFSHHVYVACNKFTVVLVAIPMELARRTLTSFQNNFHYLAKGGFWLTLAQFIGLSSSLLLSVVMANVLTPETFGQYKYLVSVFAIVAAISLHGIKLPVSLETARGNHYILKKGFQYSLLWNLGILASCSVASLYYFLSGNNLLSFGFGLVAIIAPIYYALQLAGLYMQGTAAYRSITIYSALQSIGSSLAVGITAYVSNSPLYIFVAFLLSQTIISIPVFIYTLRNVPEQEPDPKVVREAFFFGIRLTFIGSLIKIAAELDKIIVFQLLGAAQLAIYTFALAIPRQLVATKGTLEILALPKFSNHSFKSLRHGMMPKIIASFIFSLGIIALYWISAPILYKLLFPKYLDSVIYSQYLSLTILIIPVSFLRQALVMNHHEREIYVIDICEPIIRIGLYILLIPTFQIFGAIYALIVTTVLQIIYYIFVFFTDFSFRKNFKKVS